MNILFNPLTRKAASAETSYESIAGMESLLNPFPHTTNLQHTTLKSYKQKSYIFSENIVDIEEIACFEQFPLLSQCCQELSAAEASGSVYVGKG